MSEFKDFLEQHIDTIDSDWQKEMVEVNKKRERLGLPHKIFTEKEKSAFKIKWIERKSI